MTLLRPQWLLLATLFSFALSAAAQTKPPTDRYYEIRIYYPAPGKFNAIVDRFRQYTTKLFAKHGMENIGYWTPTDTTRKELIYILAFPDRAARDTSFSHFANDPAWKAVVAKTEANGKLIDRIESIFMTESNLSPRIKPVQENPARIFELRTYTAHPGQLPNLLARFRDHTKKLFATHGMSQIGYWITAGNEAGQPKLIYLLAHPTEAAGKQHFEAFRQDPAWVKAKAASEKAGPLTLNIASVYLKPTDYSPMK